MSDSSSRRWTLAVTSVAFFMTALDALVVTTALPVIGRDLQAGMATLQWAVNAYGLAPAAGRISDRIGRRPVLAAGMLPQAAWLAWFALVSGTTPHYGAMVAPLLVAGIGISMALPTTATAAMSAVAPHQLGKAAGTNSTPQRLGAVLGVAVATAALTATGGLGTAAAFTAGLRPALLVAAGLSLLGALTALALRSHTAPGTAVASATAPIPDLADATMS
ncbi:MAG TPA: MFS transporter [Actinomycetes bacterium]|nr:MFS transporter [Actinomycetes bacterium]